MMGTQSEWVYSDLQTPKVVKAAHKIPLVSPRMDVDVTGVSLKNVRTHLIDHPRDDGLKHREQLWNFQQKYRGVIGKVRPMASIGADDRKCETSGSDEQNEDDSRQIDGSRPRAINEQSSLPSRFRKRLKHKINFTGLGSSELFMDSGRRRSVPPKEQNEDDKSNSGIQRLYSSGLIVKNNLYNQLRNSNGEEKRIEHFPDNSRILEAIQKYGSLEKLPDITYPGLRSAQTPNIRFLKTLNSYNRRIIDQVSERRYLPLRRSLTNFNDHGSSKRKLIIVSRRGQNDDRIVRLGCYDTFTSNEDDDEYDENNDEVDDDGDDDEEEEEEDDDDECDNEIRISQPEKLHQRDIDQKRPEHLDIRSNITQVNTQDDLVLIEKYKQEDNNHKKQLRTERTFHGETRKQNISKEYRRTDLSGQDAFVPRCNSKARDSWNNTKVGNKDREAANNKRSQKKKTAVDNKNDESESDDSLDIPDHKFGPTTHSIDKKLAIRKPWEWKPSPYRWIDKPYVRESDKPYIERIINNGEIIDEFHYDSFARTKPLKVQSFPEGAGYKDRYGNMR
ncbi:uncharacterized protein DDB_G0283697-like [Mercenaria mercenaria]|uniref:uncharacterized protein DDB_G0283697-like n=1 Tax=Mercenaria mercenaria TaxID=6596 RepID=UPI001E1D3EBB|nr:uncharacterized protein DDB_G0283697-like [Mercenaria mercenaria]XP_045173321.1 uncharacterized protein DDB_G0283697-like [Mercenaria mercenaria]